MTEIPHILLNPKFHYFHERRGAIYYNFEAYQSNPHRNMCVCVCVCVCVCARAPERDREGVCVWVCCILTDVSLRLPVPNISPNLRFTQLLAHLHLGLPSEKYIKSVSVPSVSGVSLPTKFTLNVMSPKPFLKVNLKKTSIVALRGWKITH